MVTVFMGDEHTIQRGRLYTNPQQSFFNFRGTDASVEQKPCAIHFHKDGIPFAATGQNPNLHPYGSYLNT
jgi:hypothetical protein